MEETPGHPWGRWGSFEKAEKFPKIVFVSEVWKNISEYSNIVFSINWSNDTNMLHTLLFELFQLSSIRLYKHKI